MSFDYEIGADPAKALAAVDKVDAGNAKIEAGAKRAGQAMTSAFSVPALQNAAGQYVATGVAAQSMGDRVDALMASMDRQDAMLTKIRGPQQQYAQDLETLDEMLAKSTITTNEYADAVTNLNKRIGERPTGAAARPEGPEKPEGVNLGEVGEAVTGAAAGLGVLELGKGIAELIEDSDRLEDKYTELTNMAQKFTSANQDVNAVLSQQSKLSVDLHSTMGPTMELYERVSEGTKDLNVSQAEQIALTKVIGQTVELANKPLGEASGLMSRFAYALQNGSMDGRSLNMMMRELPPLADLLTKSFGKTSAQIVKGMNDGKISTEDLMRAMIAAGPEAQKMFDKMKPSHEQLNSEWQENYNNQYQQLGGGTTNATLAALPPEAFEQMQKWNKTIQDGFDEDQDRAHNFFVDLSQQTTLLTANFLPLGDAIRKTLGGLVDGLTSSKLSAAMDRLGKFGSDLGHQMGMYKTIWDTGEEGLGASNDASGNVVPGIGAMGTGTKTAMDFAAAAGTAKKQLADLNAAFAAGAIPVMDYRAKHEALLTTIAGGLSVERSIANELANTNRAYVEGIAAITDMIDHGAISAKNYYAELDKISKAHGDGGFAEYFDKNTALQNKVVDRNGGQSRPQLNLDETTAGTPETFELPPEDPNVKAAAEMYKAVSTPAEKYADDLAKLNDLHAKGAIDGEPYNRVLGALNDRYTAFKTPLETYQAGVKKLQQEMDVGLVSTEAYDDAMRKLRIEAGQGTFTDGIVQGVKDITKEVQSSATEISTLMKAAFDGVNTSIVQLVTTGTTDWSKLATTIEGDLAKMALHSVEGGLFNAIGASAKSAVGGASTTAAMTTGAATAAATIGTSMTTGGATAAETISTEFYAAGQGVAAQIAAAMAGGSAAGGLGGSGLLSGGLTLGGGASTVAATDDVGTDALASFATGGKWTAGGPGGSDQSLQAFWATNGEVITVHTPQQAAATAAAAPTQKGGGAMPALHIHNQTDPQKDILATVSSGAADVHIINLLKRNRSAVQAMIKK